MAGLLTVTKVADNSLVANHEQKNRNLTDLGFYFNLKLRKFYG